MSIFDDDTASVVTIEQSIIIEHGDDVDDEEIIKEALHQIQTGKGKIEETTVREK